MSAQSGYGPRLDYTKRHNGYSPHETKVTGSHVVEKHMGERGWRPMSHGDARGGDLERLIRTGEALGGHVRIVRRQDLVVVWERKSSGEIEAVVVEEGRAAE